MIHGFEAAGARGPRKPLWQGEAVRPMCLYPTPGGIRSEPCKVAPDVQALTFGKRVGLLVDAEVAYPDRRTHGLRKDG